jgi:4-hydroxy-tetrahydrodipicolinate synthase
MAGIGRHVSQLAGYAPALPTPFDQAGDLDLAAFERLCLRQIEQGATALVVCGTTGEAPNLSRAEHDSIVRAAVEVARGEVPVIAGAGSNATAQAIELARDAEAAGADAVLCVVPYYNKPTQAGMYAHFRAIADASGLPMILYDVPSRTVAGLADETIVRLAEIPRCIGLKDATGDVTRPLRLRAALGAKFRLFSGDDPTALGFFAYGGDGCISVTSNVAPGLCRAIYLAWKRGQIPRAQRLAAAAAPLTAALFRESNPAPVKYALSTMGLMSPRVRLPLVEPNTETKVEIERILVRLDTDYSEYIIGAQTRQGHGAVFAVERAGTGPLAAVRSRRSIERGFLTGPDGFRDGQDASRCR